MRTINRAQAQRIYGFGTDTGGNIAMMSGLVALPFMTMLALAVDVNYASNHRHTVQASLDSALLAAARKGIEGGATEAEMEAELANYFSALVEANGSGVVCEAPDIDPTMEGGVIKADVECYSETIMAGAIGREKIEYELDSEVNFGIGQIDVAFVFDVSGSMSGQTSGSGGWVCHNNGSNCSWVPAQTRMEALKDAAKAGVDKLLQVNGTDRDDVRIAMVSYNQAVNAGVYFEAVTGLEPQRTYYHGDPSDADAGGEAVVDQVGSRHNKIFVGLYDARDNSLVAEIRDGTVVTIPSDLEDHLTMAAEVRSTHNRHGDDESMQLILWDNSGHYHEKTENIHPYALFGDNNGDMHAGDIPTNGWAALRVRAFTGNNLSGNRFSNKKFDFRIDVVDTVPSVTVDDQCTYERANLNHWNKTTAPGSGQYLTADEATYDEDSETWTVPQGCSSATPVALTNDQAVLDAYIDALPTGGGTAGHLGFAWGRYLIAPEWEDVWPVNSTPLDYDEPDARKIIIMMTDGEFNRTYHSNLGSSFDQAKNHCDQAKEQGIIIYTISFDAPTNAQAALDYCSSGTDYSFDVNNGQELLDAYTAIANRISDLRLSY